MSRASFGKLKTDGKENRAGEAIPYANRPDGSAMVRTPRDADVAEGAIMPTRQSASPEASFIFRGTVQRVKASTVSEIKADANTAVVRVDEVMAAPPALAHAAGRDITVVAGSGGSIRAGQQAIFH